MYETVTYSRPRHRLHRHCTLRNHNLEEQAQALFMSWLNECKERIMLSELCDNVLDYRPLNGYHAIPINSSDVTDGIFSEIETIRKAELKGQFKKRFQKGDILYSEIRPRNLHYAYCYFEPTNHIASTRLMIIRANAKVGSSVLLYQYFMLPQVLEEFTLKTESRSGTFPQGNYDDLTSSMVPFRHDTQLIAKRIESIYAVIWKNYDENIRLSSIRNSLLPKLMSGELKINEINC